MSDLTPIDDTRVFREDGPPEEGLPRLGEWRWVTSKNYRQEETTWLGCAVKLGSNFVEYQTPKFDGSYSHLRVHVDDLDRMTTVEPNADAYIRSQIAAYQTKVNELLLEVRDVYGSLGVTPSLPDQSAASSTALATLNGQIDVKSYETALVLAKKETLPNLFKQIENAHKMLAGWMAAPTLPLMASVEPLKSQISGIEDRIFNISLYAGLTEHVTLLTEGAAPAAPDAKLHVMQLRRYMDEECLLEYEAGGMEFKDIHAFDAWLCRPNNRDRLLPFPRTLVAFRVRRDMKERDSEGNLLTALINLQIEQADRLTFLYIRNGDQVWRMSCEMDFGELIVPEETEFSPGEPMMVKMFASRIDGFMPRSRYDYYKAEWQKTRDLRDQWNRDNPETKDGKGGFIRNPYGFLSVDLKINGRHVNFEPDAWKPFDPTNVYYDDSMKVIADQIKEYNRIALIIQGLFDRSEALHPHPPVRTWTAEGFEAAITLVRDGNYVLYDGDKPDFEAYRARLNRAILVGSVVSGADDYWARAEGKKESDRLERDWRNKSHYRPTHFRPYGDPGPGKLARVAEWNPRTKTATFRWERQARSRDRWNERVDAAIRIPSDQLFNVSAYKPGEYRQFFRDPRTRREYLKWAPLLLAAEDFHAGKRTVEAD